MTRLLLFMAFPLLAAACTCRGPETAAPADAGVPAAETPDASPFGCADAETHLAHVVGTVEATLGACARDADCVGDGVLVDCPRATFVECGYAYAEENAAEARERVDDAAETVCTRLDTPCPVRSLDGPDCPPATVRCVDGRCRVVTAPR